MVVLNSDPISSGNVCGGKREPFGFSFVRSWKKGRRKATGRIHRRIFDRWIFFFFLFSFARLLRFSNWPRFLVSNNFLSTTILLVTSHCALRYVIAKTFQFENWTFSNEKWSLNRCVYEGEFLATCQSSIHPYLLVTLLPVFTHLCFLLKDKRYSFPFLLLRVLLHPKITLDEYSFPRT